MARARYADNMGQTKPTLARLSELASGDQGDFFALLADKTHAVAKNGKPYYRCRFRDARRSATVMVWGDDERFDACDRDWRPGQFFKLRATFEEHKQYGPQLR